MHDFHSSWCVITKSVALLSVVQLNVVAPDMITPNAVYLIYKTLGRDYFGAAL